MTAVHPWPVVFMQWLDGGGGTNNVFGAAPSHVERPRAGGVEGLELSRDVRTAGCVDDFLHTLFAEPGQSGSDVVSLSDRRREAVAVVEQRVVALGEWVTCPWVSR